MSRSRMLDRPGEQPMKPGQPGPPGPFSREPIPDELPEWARQTLDEEDLLVRIREMEAEGGGLSLDDFIAEVEARACST